MNLAAAALGAALGLLAAPWLVPLIGRLPEREQALDLFAPAVCACGVPRRGLLPRVPFAAPTCRSCGTPPARRDRVVHLVAAVLGGVLGGLAGLTAVFPAFLLLALVMVLVVFVDLDTHRIPDRITFVAFPASVALVALGSFVEGGSRDLVRALIGSALFFVVLLVLHLVYPAGMGFGDVKLAPTLGLFLGYTDPVLVVYALLASSLIGIAVALPAVVRGGRKTEFPFGPALCAGCVLVLAAGETIISTLTGT
jgi:leader peptidase (prepilin peptidase) / N-methyltransferase